MNYAEMQKLHANGKILSLAHIFGSPWKTVVPSL